MTYKHLTIDELTMIESYYLQHNKPVERLRQELCVNGKNHSVG